MEENYLGFTKKDVLEKIVGQYSSVDEEFKKNNQFYIDQILTLKEEDITFEKVEVQPFLCKWQIDVTGTGTTEYTERTINHTIETEENLVLFCEDMNDYQKLPSAIIKELFGISAEETLDYPQHFAKNYCRKYFERLDMRYSKSRINEQHIIEKKTLPTVIIYGVMVRLKGHDGKYIFKKIADIVSRRKTSDAPEIVLRGVWELDFLKTNERCANERKERRLGILKILGGVVLVLALIGSCAIC